MPEIPLTLLKEKIIKTDIIIQLLAEKNEQIAQLREKLKLLYHKHVKKVKECEELQLKIDLCKIEHDPLDRNLKELLQKYEDLQEQHQLLTNTSEIRYQNKCMELEMQISNYNDLLRQKEKCSTCHGLSNKFNSINKKYEKINKELLALTVEYENSQKEIRILNSNNLDVEKKFSSQLKTMKEEYVSEITNLENLVTTLKFSESKLEDEILHLRNKLDILNPKSEDCTVKEKSEYYEDNVTTQQSNDSFKDCEYIRNLLQHEYVGEPLSPIISPLNTVILTEVRGNEYVEARNLSSESVATNLDGNDENYLSECEDFIEDTTGCDEIGDIQFSGTTSPMSDREAVIANNSYNNSEDIHQKDVDNNCNEDNKNNSPEESELITFNRIIDIDDDSKQISPEKVKSQQLYIDLDLSSKSTSNSPENSDIIINKEVNISSKANLGIINGGNETLEQRSNNPQIYFNIMQIDTFNLRNEENTDVVLSDNDNQFKSNIDVSQSMNCDAFNSNLYSTETRCTKSLETNVINAETTFALSTGNQSWEVLYLEYNEYLHKIRFQSNNEKYTPILKARDLIGFLEKNCMVKETDNISDVYNKTLLNTDNCINVPFESEASSIIGKDVLTLHDIGIQTETGCGKDIIDTKSSSTSNAITKTDLKKPALNESINTFICEHINYIDDTSTNLLNDALKCQRGSNEYSPYSILNGDFLGFVKKGRKPTSKERPEVRVIRKRVGWKRMKAELFHSLVKYFNKKMKFNQTNFLRRGCNKTLSSNSKSVRHSRMLRWKKLRELYLSSTDTDSDLTKNFRPVKKRNKCKSQENNLSKQISDECNISEDEHIFRIAISEQRKFQRLLLEHQQLEDFYNSFVNDVMNNGVDNQTKEDNALSFSKCDNGRTCQQDNVLFITDKDDVNSGDSGYSKSDSDNFSIKRDYKKKRIGDFESDKHIHTKKRAIMKSSSNKICDLRRDERSCIVNYEKKNCGTAKTDISKVENINSERSHDAHLAKGNQESVGASHCSKLKKEHITADICSLLHSSSSEENEIPCDDGMSKETFDINQHYLFGSDCEAISTDDDDDKSTRSILFDIETNSHTTEDEAKNVGAFNYDHTAVASYNKQSYYDSMNKPSNQIGQLNHSPSTSKISMKQVRKKPKTKIHNTPFSNESTPSQIQEPLDVEDPLHVRLQQESFKKVPHILNTDAAIPVSFKRSNSLKNRRAQLQTIAQNIGLNKTVIPSKEIDILCGKPKRIHEEKAKALLQQVLTFPDKPSIVNEVAEIFSMQDMTYITRIIILEVSLDTNKADTKYTPPAPVLTKTQRILLGFLVKLNQNELPGILDIFIMEAEKYILTSTNLQCIANLTRLYLAVCKLERKIHRMRRMVCDAFYFMGDFSIPFLFTVLSTWIEVMPMESDIHGGLMVKVIIEIIKQKKCASPGYNLIPLKSLLKAYYGYNMEDSCLDSLFFEIIHEYQADQKRSLEYAIRILSKNVESTWITQKIEQYIKPAIESTDNVVLKRNLFSLIENISQENACTSG